MDIQYLTFSTIESVTRFVLAITVAFSGMVPGSLMVVMAEQTQSWSMGYTGAVMALIGYGITLGWGTGPAVNKFTEWYERTVWWKFD